MAGKNKTPKTSNTPAALKQPKSNVSVNSPNKIPKSTIQEQTINGQHLTWRFSCADRNHDKWGWQNLSGRNLERLMDCLQSFETMSWKDILRQGSHEISLGKLPTKPYKRLVDLQKDDWDQIVSFRIGQGQRAWFLRQGSLMRALWWDPNHSVFPSKKSRKKHER